MSIKPCSKQSLVLDLDLDELTINIGNLYDVCYYCLMPHLYELESWPEKGGYPLPLLSAKVNLSERLYEKNLIPVGANSAFWLSRHDRVDRAVQAKVFIWRKVGSAWLMTLQSQKADTPPAKPPFCFLCKRFAMFCK